MNSLFVHPLARQIRDLDSWDTCRIHRQIVAAKPALRDFYTDAYRRLMKPFAPGSRVVELGAGGFHGKDCGYDIVASDLVKHDYVDIAIDAQAMSLADASVDGFVMFHVLHHIPQPRRLFAEVQRCLRVEGTLTMIEPYFSPWGHFVYRYLHHENCYDQPSWDLPPNEVGRLSGANSRGPYNIFIRDRRLFEERYPNLLIADIQLHNAFWYLMTGGLSYRCLLPRGCRWLGAGIENTVACLAPLLATSMLIQLKRR